ncbi:CatB-related O-acetyltransferase [Spiroplasma tabanidicola]|uniref:Virginiamycin A acetyltransferase n=1 Tax=Spiroplasma tabanidicola TaxID=324079 RepID=A0A6I6C9A3_9MOLU|nr:CatB-related O-acetyltransferase [Spiroplasma tabanidicola]QGS51485.1 virginiamycin A acetyltransferase [Spiroplasma tabanidicola]
MAKSNKINFLKPYITNEGIEVGDYTYFYSFNGEQGLKEFQNKNVLYHFYKISNNKLIIGKFCAIADEVKFIMSGANHRINSLSTFPFEMFDEFNDEHDLICANPVFKGDTVVGNDVWIGYGATILPGIKIGNGAIIGAKTVVSKDVDPYTVVAGNPCKVIKTRFDNETIKKLQDLKWWDKSEKEIKKLIPLLTDSNNNL